jgi:hypothetical protein
MHKHSNLNSFNSHITLTITAIRCTVQGYYNAVSSQNSGNMELWHIYTSVYKSTGSQSEYMKLFNEQLWYYMIIKYGFSCNETSSNNANMIKCLTNKTPSQHLSTRWR